MVKKSFADICPELAKEWHPTRNGDLTPSDVTAGSSKRVWWYLPYDDPNTGKHFDFEWQASVSDRTNGRGCPYIVGKAIWKGYNDLATTNPELIQEWHPTKNGCLTPEKITAGSGKKVWWFLPYDDPVTGKHFDFEWEAYIKHRAKGVGCPFLSRKAIWKGFNDLETTNPELVKEWHPTKNGNVTPSDVSAGLSKKVWWFLPYDDPVTGKHYDFEWQAFICHRARGVGCPFLSNQAVWKGYNDLATINPKLAKEWHPSKNDVSPEDVTIGAEKKVWWILPYDDPITGKHFDFEWQARIADRLHGDGCPYITNQSIWKGYNDLSTTNPELAKEWHPTKNGNLKPENITAGAERKVWWYLPYDDPITGKHFDFEWQASVYHRSTGMSCPYIAGKAVWIGYNNLATTNPELAKEWHPTKNGELTPYNLTSGSNKKVWWYLPYDDPVTGKHFDFEWEAIVISRVKGAGCPFTVNQAVWKGYNDLATTNPELAKEWHPTKNRNITPSDITAGANKKIWWLCSKQHEWVASLGDRKNGRGCPLCNETRGERKVRTILEKYKVVFAPQYSFEGMKYKNELKCDFAILDDYGYPVGVIEYNGEQHYKPVDFAGKGEKWAKKVYQVTIKRDKTKAEYLQKNGIPLLVIPYWEFDIIEQMVRGFIKSITI